MEVSAPAARLTERSLSRPDGRLYAWAAALLALVAATLVGAAILRMPLQLTDSLLYILGVQRAHSTWDLFVNTLFDRAYLRPLRMVQIKWLFDAAHGHYFAVYKGFNVALVVAGLLLFVRALHVRSRLELLIVPWALAMLVGMHTFLNVVAEGYPINHYLEIVVLCLAAFNLADSRGGIATDVAAVVVLLVALFTFDSGVLVWVVLASAWIAGMRGVSTRAIALTTAILVGYLYLRFGYLHVGVPGLEKRATGFGLSQLEPDELVARFGANPLPLYAYNVVCSILSVLFAEPRGGTWFLAKQMSAGSLSPWASLTVICQILGTTAIVSQIVRRAPAWRQWTLDRADRACFVFVGVLLGNAALSFAYTKNEIMSPAGAFYAIAVAVSVAELLRAAIADGRWTRWSVALAGATVICAGIWTMRAADLGYQLKYMGWMQRNQWASSDEWLRQQGETIDDPVGLAIYRQLQTEALQMPVTDPQSFPGPLRRRYESRAEK